MSCVFTVFVILFFTLQFFLFLCKPLCDFLQSNFWGFHGLSVDVAHVDAPMAEDKIMLEFLGIISQYCCVSHPCLCHVVHA